MKQNRRYLALCLLLFIAGVVTMTARSGINHRRSDGAARAANSTGAIDSRAFAQSSPSAPKEGSATEKVLTSGRQQMAIAGGRLHFMKVDPAKKSSSLISVDIGDLSSEVNLLPLSVAADIVMPQWKITDSHVHTISVQELIPKQPTFTLVKIKIDDLKSMWSPEKTSKSPVKWHRMQDIVAAASPLNNAYYRSQIEKDAPFWYDFSVKADGSYKFYILSKGKLNVWKYEDSAWKQIADFQSAFECPFNIFEGNEGAVLLASNGDVYLLEDSKMKKVGAVAVPAQSDTKKVSYLVENRDTAELYSILAEKSDGAVTPLQTKVVNGRAIHTSNSSPNFIHAMNAALKSMRESK
ncbi:MAG TPA: hypothetical protein VJ842_14550 [Pyrinomonadaceae bacterium]|nr:hypothetical protein [Pyrinomonadaceae bacterium]